MKQKTINHILGGLVILSFFILGCYEKITEKSPDTISKTHDSIEAEMKAKAIFDCWKKQKSNHR